MAAVARRPLALVGGLVVVTPPLERRPPFTSSAILCIDGTALFVRRLASSLNRGGVGRWSRTLPGELLDRTICGVLRNGRWRSQGFHPERGGVSDARMLPQDPATPVGFADGGVEVLSCHALLVTERSGRS